MTAEDQDTIGVKANIGGRRLTLDPLLPVVPLEIEPRRVESNIPCGLRVSWFDGTTEHEGQEISFIMAAGAGFGSRWLTLHVTMPDGSSRDEVVDMADVCRTWVQRVIETKPTPEVTA